MISKEYAQFFKELAKNNKKEWFHANKKRYESDVKKPFLDLLELLIPKIEKLEPKISQNPKDALFRINKDVRFSKDKTPYHTIMKAGFSPDGKKSIFPGFYLGISAEEIHVGGGLFMVQPAELLKIRTYIKNNSDEFLSIVANKKFTSKLGNLLGDKSKRYDKTFMEFADKNPFIANKQFYAMADIPLKEHLNSTELPNVIMEHFNTIHPLNTYLYKAMSR